MAGDAVRLAQRVDGVAGEVGDGLAGQLVGGAAVELEVARQRPGVGARLGQRLADVAGLEPGQLLGALLDQPADAREQAAALGGGRPAPVAGERGAGRGDRGVDLAGAAAGDPADLAPSDGSSAGSVPAAAGTQAPPIRQPSLIPPSPGSARRR